MQPTGGGRGGGRERLRKVRRYDACHACLTFLAVNGLADVVLAVCAGHANAAFMKKYVPTTAADMGQHLAHWSDAWGLQGPFRAQWGKA